MAGDPGDEPWDPDWQRKIIDDQRRFINELRRSLSRIREELEPMPRDGTGSIQWVLDHISDVMMRGPNDERG